MLPTLPTLLAGISPLEAAYLRLDALHSQLVRRLRTDQT
jgi:hypothetical protein